MTIQDEQVLISLFPELKEDLEEVAKYLSGPSAAQRNGDAYLVGGLASIKENIEGYYWYKGVLVIETNLYHSVTSTANTINPLSKGGGIGVQTLKLYFA